MDTFFCPIGVWIRGVPLYIGNGSEEQVSRCSSLGYCSLRNVLGAVVIIMSTENLVSKRLNFAANSEG